MVTALLAVVLTTAACQTFSPEEGLGLYAAGDFEAAHQNFADRGKSAHDELIWLLEEAKIQRDLGRYKESSETFERALALFSEFELLRADISVSEELKSVLGGQIWRDYRGSFSDAILATTMLALNDMALGNWQNARAACRQGYEWQNESKIRHAEELERADELAKKEDVNREELMSDPGVQQEMAAIQSFVAPGYANYINPLASFVSAIGHYGNGDAVEGRKALEEVAGMIPDNEHVAALLGGSQEPSTRTVYLIFERGMAPYKQEFRLTLPSPSGVLPVAVPRLRPQQDSGGFVRITGGSGTLDVRTQHLANVDSIIATQFGHEFPGILVRTVIATAAKEAGGYAATRATEDENSYVQAGAWLAVNLFKAATSGADLRTWRTIGSEYQVAVFSLPADGSFTAELIGQDGASHHRQQLTLGDAPVSVVTARSIDLNVFKLFPPATASAAAPGPGTAPSSSN